MKAIYTETQYYLHRKNKRWLTKRSRKQAVRATEPSTFGDPSWDKLEQHIERFVGDKDCSVGSYLMSQAERGELLDRIG